MADYLNKIKEVFTMPSISGEEPLEETRGLFSNHSVRIALAIVFVVVSAFVMAWIMA